MTLPFRRRHHDDETVHDRARALWSTAMLEPLEPDDSTWLATHLDGCAECRLEHQAYLADRVLLRTLRDHEPQPPRDLWARTSAAIEREAARGARRETGLQLGDRLVPRQIRLPLGVLSGVLVVLVVVATSLAPRDGGTAIATNPPGSDIARLSPAIGPSPLAVNPAPVAWVQVSADGTIRVITADVDEVCPSEKTGCAPLQQTTGGELNLGAAEALVASPSSNQLVVASGSQGSHPGSVLVVPVPTAVVAPTATPPGASSGSTVTPTAPPTSPAVTPSTSGAPTPVPTPEGARSIAEGVTVVGETRYSTDGKWLAFSARPLDGSTGPDLYVWDGTAPTAVRVTDDHATYFSSWLGDTILASRVVNFRRGPATPGDSRSPEPTDGTASPGVRELHPTSFVFDPTTATSTDLALADVWLPTVDPTGRFMTYWSGTLFDGPGHSDKLALGNGRLVLDGWLTPLGAVPASASPTGSGATIAVGPAGTPIELTPGPITGFDTQFDTTGTRLAVWVADASDPNVGTLRLVVLDRALGAINDHLAPLQSERALKGVSIDKGRLAWVSPPGQDGNQSSVRVLAWLNDDFGQVQTLPGEQLAIIR